MIKQNSFFKTVCALLGKKITVEGTGLIYCVLKNILNDAVAILYCLIPLCEFYGGSVETFDTIYELILASGWQIF